MAIGESLLTAEEFALMTDAGPPTELVLGRIVELCPPNDEHGFVCGNVSGLLWSFMRANDLGRVFTNDTGVITRRGPDSVRGMDVAFISYARMPKGRFRKSYVIVAPEVVFEVRSPGDRWKEVREKVAEYLAMGVLVVCVLDPDTMSAHLSTPDGAERTLGPDDEFAIPECLGDFRVAVRELVE